MQAIKKNTASLVLLHRFQTISSLTALQQLDAKSLEYSFNKSFHSLLVFCFIGIFIMQYLILLTWYNTILMPAWVRQIGIGILPLRWNPCQSQCQHGSLAYIPFGSWKTDSAAVAIDCHYCTSEHVHVLFVQICSSFYSSPLEHCWMNFYVFESLPPLPVCARQWR